ncbi:hypothetical protein TorRG33x02_250830 [Trema orientale]|uniref:Uncharacterized protein n=1 Tax=Trema orientale TaxID=63057 RepID=A0A2P5DHV9_TREOI|nr:hypothetical protein TorRG33x02_250830 [Trema orientale]
MPSSDLFNHLILYLAILFGFTDPCRHINIAFICFAGDGGGNGLLKNCFGIEIDLTFVEDLLGEDFLEKSNKPDSDGRTRSQVKSFVCRVNREISSG